MCSRSAEEMNNSQLSELEEDLQRQVSRAEDRVRAEVRVLFTAL